MSLLEPPDDSSATIRYRRGASRSRSILSSSTSWLWIGAAIAAVGFGQSAALVGIGALGAVAGIAERAGGGGGIERAGAVQSRSVRQHPVARRGVRDGARADAPALDTHSRQGDSDPLLVNFAHDYIINDMLGEELGRDPPLGGLQQAGAARLFARTPGRRFSEGVASGQSRLLESARERPQSAKRGYAGRLSDEAGTATGGTRAGRSAGGDRSALVAGRRDSSGFLEDRLEPHIPPSLRQRLREEVRCAAAKAAALGKLRKQMAEASQDAKEPERGEALMRALRDAYDTPWERALQRWFEAVAPGERTYMRPSRRRHARSDVVLPGRRREGWMLHVLLDTSGSMVDILPRALGAIGYFAENNNVAQVHVVQCDTEVTHDDWLEPQQLEQYQIGGFGYSDMSPGFRHVALDPEVNAVLMLTDGYIDYPAVEPPFRVVWVLIGQYDPAFDPRYGEVIQMDLR